MDAVTIIVLSICAAIVVLAVAFLLLQRQHSRRLKDDFGSEYERTLRARGTSSRAERDLEMRRKRVEALGIRPLSRDQLERYSDRWRDVQARFVEEPQSAIDEADRLLNDVMMARGYPVGDFERQVEDLSVDHGRVIAGYRKAHRIVGSREGGVEPGTEEVRQAFLCYREVFNELLDTEAPVAARAS